MRIAQLVLNDAPLYETKMQRIDAQMLAAECDVAMWPCPDATLVHVYGPRELPARLFRNFPLPYVASGAPKRARFRLASPRRPAADTSSLPEAIESQYLNRDVSGSPHDRCAAGVFVGGRNVRPLVEATAHRLARFRDDVDWHLFEVPPRPDDFAAMDLWLDPARDDEDRDGWTAEALVAGVHVVATRTAVNRQRLDDGRLGFLAPLDDPNELTHAIVTALFKPDISAPRLEAARSERGRFAPEHRRDALLALYREVAS